LRKLLSITLILVSAVSMSGCAPASQADLVSQLKPICKTYTTGSALDSLTANTDLKKMPETKFTPGVTSSKIETKIITEGTGPKLVGNQLIYMEYEGLNGGTGKAFQASKHDGTDTVVQYLKKDAQPNFCDALTGVKVGSRVAILFPPKLAHAGNGVPSLNIGKTDSIVFVLDVKSAALPYAVGSNQPAQNGFPSVVFAPDGTPGFTFAKAAAPSKYESEKLIVGNGETIKEGDTVTLNYSGIVYGGNATFDSSWSKGQPAQFTITKTSMISGFYKAVIGAKVGDRIVAIIPPSEGYGATATGSIPPNSTLVFVIDLLYTEHAKK
jgi:FKBP-type peptidyl-prolyl cis-trans isomerase